MDIKDLYYSLPQAALSDTLQEEIKKHGPVSFQNVVGTSVSRFLESLFFYLSNTVVRQEERFYVQKEGVCIGSCIEPILSDLLLAKYDRRLEESLTTIRWVSLHPTIEERPSTIFIP